MKVIFAVVLFVSAAQAAFAGSALSALSFQSVELESAAPAPVSPAAPVIDEDRKPDTATIEVDASVMKDKASLMNEFVRKMKLPEQVDNWDALIEYLSDMPETLNVKKVVYLVKHAPVMQKNNPALYNDLMGAMQDAADRTKEWSKGRAKLEFYLLP